MFYLSRSEQVVLFLLLALLLAGAGVLTYGRGRHGAGGGGEEPILVAAPEPAGSGGEIVVDVSGAVERPGVYRLAPGSRVADAVGCAGGATSEADLGGLNLAARVHDGERITVPRQSGSGAGVGPGGGGVGSGGARGRISLNEATAAELESLPGIGRVFAERITAYRDRKMQEEGHGFQSVDELLNIPGIGPRRLAALRERVAP